MLTRYASSILVASGVTFGLFFIMQLLIATGNDKLVEDDSVRRLDMFQAERDEDVRRDEREVEKPPEPEIPPEVDIPQREALKPTTSINMQVASVSADINVGGGLFDGTMDGEYLPIVKPSPIYPRRALERGVSGWVIVEFTVTELGQTENPIVIQEEPKGYFGRAAVNAAKKFKYKPKVVNGEPIRVPGVKNKITFNIDE